MAGVAYDPTTVLTVQEFCTEIFVILV